MDIGKGFRLCVAFPPIRSRQYPLTIGLILNPRLFENLVKLTGAQVVVGGNLRNGQGILAVKDSTVGRRGLLPERAW